MKRVLVLCTGNSCRSIMAEALIDKYLSQKGVQAFSAGSNPTGEVARGSRKILKDEGIWSDKYYSKDLNEVDKFAPFDLVVTVCDNAKESCVNYTNCQDKIHFRIDDPANRAFSEFERVRDKIEFELIPLIEERLKL